MHVSRGGLLPFRSACRALNPDLLAVLARPRSPGLTLEAQLFLLLFRSILFFFLPFLIFMWSSGSVLLSKPTILIMILFFCDLLAPGLLLPLPLLVLLLLPPLVYLSFVC